MFKYEMLINGEPYNAYFVDHFEAGGFLAEVVESGDKVELVRYYEVSAQDILNDNSMEWSYRVEMASVLLVPNYKDFTKWVYLEAELRKMGYVA